jgi:hypothetical protein
MRKEYLAAAMAAIVGSGLATAQPATPRPGTPTGYDLPISRASRTELPDPKPTYKYELKPESGDFLVVVKSFRGPVASDEKGQARELAEGLAEYIRSQERLYAYVYESGWAMRQERTKEKEQVLAAMKKYYSEQGVTPTEEMLKIRMARIPDEYTVFVAPGKGSLKTLDEALEFARYIRKLKAPPADFCDAIAVGTERDISRRQGEKINPFLQVFAGRNPTLPPKKDAQSSETPKADDTIMAINSGKPYSLIHGTRKKFTLVVKVYGSNFGQVLKPGEVSQASAKPDGELLERAAQQAQDVAKVLRGLDQEAYVLHTRYESFLCIGEYDSKDDPKLLALKEKLAGQPLKDAKTGRVVETFMEKPLPAMIPRP